MKLCLSLFFEARRGLLDIPINFDSIYSNFLNWRFREMQRIFIIFETSDRKHCAIANNTKIQYARRLPGKICEIVEIVKL